MTKIGCARTKENPRNGRKRGHQLSRMITEDLFWPGLPIWSNLSRSARQKWGPPLAESYHSMEAEAAVTFSGLVSAKFFIDQSDRRSRRCSPRRSSSPISSAVLSRKVRIFQNLECTDRQISSSCERYATLAVCFLLLFSSTLFSIVFGPNDASIDWCVWRIMIWKWNENKWKREDEVKNVWKSGNDVMF